VAYVASCHESEGTAILSSAAAGVLPYEVLLYPPRPPAHPTATGATAAADHTQEQWGKIDGVTATVRVKDALGQSRVAATLTYTTKPSTRLVAGPFRLQ
jgi:hypothetical protein